MASGDGKVSFKERLDDLLKDCSVSGSRDSNQLSIPKIQRVQPYLRKRTDFEKYYSPKLLSIGPIHHGHKDLKLGEQQKRRWAKAYFVDADTAEKLHQNIANNFTRLKELYSEDAIKKYKDDDSKDAIEECKDDDLIWMLFVDGCSLLHVMNNAGTWDIKAAEALEIKMDQLALLLQDMLLLENQLPYELLVLLTGDKEKPMESMLKLLRNHKMVRAPNTDNSHNTNNDSHEVTIYEGPAHLLHLLHQILVGPSTRSPSPETQRSGGPKPFNSYKIRNIKELKAAGVSVKRSINDSIEAVNFMSKSYRFWAPGDLELPEIIVDDFTAPTFMNLIAHEMCPDFLNNFDISSYVAFLDLLIDHQDDVKELRSAGVLQNHLGNDEEVAKLFNNISTDLIANVSKYARVRSEIEKHCDHKRNTWMAEVLNEHFSSPWTFIAFLTAVTITGLTLVQTWFAINPRK